MRVIITGDRNWADDASIRHVLTALHAVHPDTIIVQGGARGADHIARRIAEALFGPAQVETHPADWYKYGRAAGLIRNQFMLDESYRRAIIDGHKVRLGIAFHADLTNSRGTKDMCHRLLKAGIPVKIIRGSSHDTEKMGS